MIFKNGCSGLEKVCIYIFDFIFFDIMMFEMDGIEMCWVLKIDFEYCYIFILLFIVKGEDIDCVYVLEIGVDDYLAKLFIMRELCSCI